MKLNYEATLFVFYNFGENIEYWTYGKFPKSWWWVGSGTTNPTKVNKIDYKYSNEEQFCGSKIKQKAMRLYLDKYFTKLKEKKIIKNYKIRNSYVP
jgi:hypothetical protein